jgi:DUF4097 and DUF4098 domain-containing protein YvlB
MLKANRVLQITGTAAALLGIMAIAESRKDYRFTVGPKATISVVNDYGPISVRPSTGSQVVVTATLHSDKVEVDNDQSGNRVQIHSHLLNGATQDTGKVDYELLVPADASVTLHSSTGPLRAERLNGDVTLEGAAANVDVHDISDAHVHVNTVSGIVNVGNVRNGHVEITSVSGPITLVDVSGPKVQVSSTSGNISYAGDFGGGGEYQLVSHTGDIAATVPEGASFDVTARSVHGSVDNGDLQFQPKNHTFFSQVPGSAFAGTMGKAASSVVLRTFSGKIHLKKR